MFYIFFFFFFLLLFLFFSPLGCHFFLLGVFPHPGIETASLLPPALAGSFFTTIATWEAHSDQKHMKIERNFLLIFFKWKITLFPKWLQWLKNPSAIQEIQERWVPSLDQDYPLEKEMPTRNSILPRKISWTEEHGRLQFVGS